MAISLDAVTASRPTGEYLANVPLSAVEPDPDNERPDVDHGLDELVSSLRALGLQERVRLYSLGGERYQIASGHRRVVAARMLGWPTIAAVVCPPSPDLVKHTVSRLTSNLCRKDIDPISLALTVRALCEDHKVPLPDVARWLGKSTAAVSNLLRLLQLPAQVQGQLRSGALSVGHALQLLRIQNPEVDWFGTITATSEECQIRLANAAIEENLSVRALEIRVRNWLGNNQAVQAWLHKQQERPQASIAVEAYNPHTQDMSTQPLPIFHSDTDDQRQQSRRSSVYAAVSVAIDFDDEAGPTIDHLRLGVLMLADAVYHYHNPTSAGLPDQRDMTRTIEKALDSSALLNIVGRLVNAAILDDLNADGTDFAGNRRTRWAKSRFHLSTILSQL